MASRPVPTSRAIVASLMGLLPELPVAVAAGVVYGSVARGRHHADSDIDALLVTETALSAADSDGLVELYMDFEIAIGLRPDPVHPVEIFTVDECRSLLGLSTRPPTARTDSLTPPRSCEDAWEVLYALTTPHLVLTGQDLIADLRAAALRRLAQLQAWNSTGRPDPGRR